MRIWARQMALLGGAAVLAAAAGAARADVKHGFDLWQAGDYAGAVREWRPLAEKGDPDAQFDLGQAYKLGRGVPADLRTAQSWYEKAAQQGHPQAQANLGLILFQNGERQKAMPYITRAAEAGDPRAQYVLGTALFNGDIIGKDWPRAYALMTRAASKGLPNAASNLSAMDKYIPLPQRKQGLAIADQMARAEKAPTAVAAAAPKPAPRIASSAVQSSPPAPKPARPAPAAQPPRVAVAIPQKPAASTGGGWKIQLGAFGNATNANRQWTVLRAKVGAFAGLHPITVQAGAVTRLQAGPLPSRAAAEHACAAAKAAGSACFPVAP